MKNKTFDNRASVLVRNLTLPVLLIAGAAAALPWRPPRARLCDSDTFSDAGAGPPDWAA